MAKCINGILGNVSGKIGNIVACVRDGKTYFRTIPIYYHDANTPKQQFVRGRIKAIDKLGVSINNEIINPIWNKKAVQMNGWDYFIQTNIQHFDISRQIINYENFRFSVGDLSLPEDFVIENNRVGESSLLISWNNKTGNKFDNPNDVLLSLILSSDNPPLFTDHNVTRDKQKAIIKLPNNIGEMAHIYLFFRNNSRTKYSENNAYLCYKAINQ